MNHEFATAAQNNLKSYITNSNESKNKERRKQSNMLVYSECMLLLKKPKDT